MERFNPHDEGGRQAITSHQEPAVPSVDASDVSADNPMLPLTFAEAVRRSPFTLLTELHDQAVHNYREPAPEPFLVELALSAAVIHWWTRWQPIAMQRAFAAGACLDQVATAMGMSTAEALERWSDWANTQSRLIIGGKPSLDPVLADSIRQRLNSELPRPSSPAP